MPRKIMDSQFTDVNIRSCPIILRAFGGGVVPSVGRADLTIEFNSQQLIDSFVIADVKYEYVIIGCHLRRKWVL